MAPLADLPDNHDLPHLWVAMQYAPHYRTALDGGAHRGIWTRELLKRFSRVVAVEPVKENFLRLANEVRPNGEGCLEAHEAALGHEERTVVFLAPGPENTGQWHVVDDPMDGCDTSKMMTVDALGLVDLDFMKLDLEGYELFALQGAEETIARCRPAIMVERCGSSTLQHAMVTQRYGYTDDAVDEWLREHDYKMFVRQNKDYLYLPQ